MGNENSPLLRYDSIQVTFKIFINQMNGKSKINFKGTDYNRNITDDVGESFLES